MLVVCSSEKHCGYVPSYCNVGALDVKVLLVLYTGSASLPYAHRKHCHVSSTDSSFSVLAHLLEYEYSSSMKK